MTELLWPTYLGPDDLAAIETIPLAERGLPGTTYDVLLRAADLFADLPATSFLPDAEHWDEPAVRTFAELASDVHQIANLYTSLGIERADAVALVAQNCAGLLPALLAAEAAGIAAPINPGLATEHARRLLELAGARVLVVAGPELSAPAWELGRALAAATGATALLALRPTGARGGPALEPVAGVQVAYLDDLTADQPADRLMATPPTGADIASYFHTGGTTGTPKLAAHTHAGEVANAWMIAASGTLDDDSVLFAALPLFHVNAVVVTGLAPLLRGQHVLWAGPLGYRDVALYGVFWKMVERYRIATMSGVPTVYAVLATVPVDADISSLRFAIVGAAPLPPAVRDAFFDATGVALLEGYGLTEGTCASARNFPDYPRPGSVGQRMPYQQVRAVTIDDTTGMWGDVAPGEVGVLAISGPTVFPGYLVADGVGRRVEATGKVVDGWLDTGDLARIEADGYIYLVGRSKDLIIRGGHNIDPAVVEDALLAHGDVTAASAVGYPDAHAGEVPVAYVTVAPGATADPVLTADLVAWAGAHVPERAAAPKYVIVLDALPFTDVGKPFKPELRRDAAERAAQEALAGLGSARAVLVDGAVQVLVTTDDRAAAQAVLDALPINWSWA